MQLVPYTLNAKILDIVFALVTVSGSLIVYNMNIPARALVKIAAHGEDASTLDWHPTRPFVLATGGSADRCVKGKVQSLQLVLLQFRANILLFAFHRSTR